jgi:two-component system chemotaxis response regulator CheY
MRSVLVVDDNLVNRKLAVALLQRRGMQTEEAENGLVALSKLANGYYDSVLLDISMPLMDGEEVCRHIRANTNWSEMRVIAYTAHALESERSRIMASGFDDVLIKPISINDLLRVLPD